MKNKTLLLLGLWAMITVVAVGIAWQQFWKAARLEAQLAGGNIVELQNRLATAEQQRRSLETQLASHNEAATERAAREAIAPATRDANQGWRGRRGDFGAVMDQPAVVQLRALQQRAALDPRFAPLFKSLNLAPAKLDQFKTLLAERESTMQDLMMTAREQGIDPRSDPAAFRQLVATAQAETDTQLKSLLGDDAYAQYQQYSATQPQRATVEQLRTSLSYTSDPLTDAQAAQLVQILAATSPQNAEPVGPPPGGGRGPGGGMMGGGGGATITSAAVAQAQSVLSTAQVAALEQLQSLQQAQQQAAQMLRNSENNAGATPARGARSSGNG